MMHWFKSSKKTCGPDLFPHQKLVLLVWLARLQLHSRTQTKGLWIYVGAPVQDALSTQHPWSNPLRSREKMPNGCTWENDGKCIYQKLSQTSKTCQLNVASTNVKLRLEVHLCLFSHFFPAGVQETSNCNTEEQPCAQ